MTSFRIAVPLMMTVLACATGQPAPHYEVYAIKYATIKDFSMSALIADGDPAGRMDTASMVWLLDRKSVV